MFRLNISHTQADSALQETLDQIDGELLVERALGASSVEATVKKVVRRVGGPAFSVELVAHAKDGVLGLGEWTVDDQGTTVQDLKQRWAAELSRIRAGQILVLGCNTAATTAGQNALVHLQDVLGAKVAGATVPLYARDFDAGGLIAMGVLADSTSFPNPIDASREMERWFARFIPRPGLDLQNVLGDLRRETLRQATSDWRRTYPTRRWPLRLLADEAELRSCFQHVVPTFASAPGLLALPERELVAPVAGEADRYHRLTILLGGYLARVYPRNQPGGVLLRAPSSLHDKLPAGVELDPGPEH